MDKLKPYLPWIYRAVGLLVVVLLVVAWNNARSARNELSALLEREKLEKADLLVEHGAAKKELKQREGELLMANADLEIEVERLKDTLGKKPAVIEVVKWMTKEVPVSGTPILIPCPGGTTVDCLLPPGSTGHVEAMEITYETKENNHVMVGKAICYRDTPLPAAKFFESVFSASLSSAIQKPEEASPFSGWGGGIRGAVDRGGWALGPVLAFPPLPFLFSTRVEISADAGFGPAGNYQAGLSAILRK